MFKILTQLQTLTHSIATQHTQEIIQLFADHREATSSLRLRRRTLPKNSSDVTQHDNWIIHHHVLPKTCIKSLQVALFHVQQRRQVY